jgi:hypothetical protein
MLLGPKTLMVKLGLPVNSRNSVLRRSQLQVTRNNVSASLPRNQSPLRAQMVAKIAFAMDLYISERKSVQQTKSQISMKLRKVITQPTMQTTQEESDVAKPISKVSILFQVMISNVSVMKTNFLCPLHQFNKSKYTGELNWKLSESKKKN